MNEPYCLAMVLCDAVHVDPATKKFTILGTFSTFAAHNYPVKVAFSIYYAVTDGLGDVTMRVQLVDASVGFVDATDGEQNQDRVFSLTSHHMFPNPLAVIEGGIGVECLLLSKGLYHCELWANDNLLMTRRFTASEIGDRDTELPRTAEAE